jgi:hypothetical protein
MTAGHHPRCPGPRDDACTCARLWAAEDAEDDPYGLACAYGQFYDPDWESEPYAEREPYGGWNRAYQGVTQ